MAFNHQSMATEGLYPTLFSHFSFAVLGTFFFGITVEPKKNDLGYYDLEYEVTIFVTYKNKTWKTSRLVSYFTGTSLENIITSFKGIRNRFDVIVKKVRLINTSVKKIFVSIKSKG